MLHLAEDSGTTSNYSTRKPGRLLHALLTLISPAPLSAPETNLPFAKIPFWHVEICPPSPNLHQFQRSGFIPFAWHPDTVLLGSASVHFVLLMTVSDVWNMVSHKNEGRMIVNGQWIGFSSLYASERYVEPQRRRNLFQSYLQSITRNYWIGITLFFYCIVWPSHLTSSKLAIQ